MSIKDNLGIENGDISRQMINRVIDSICTKFVGEISNYYHLFVPYLTNYKKKYQWTLSIVQVDEKNWFYRTVISILNIESIFKNCAYRCLSLTEPFTRRIFMLVCWYNCQLNMGSEVRFNCSVHGCQSKTGNILYFFAANEINEYRHKKHSIYDWPWSLPFSCKIRL